MQLGSQLLQLGREERRNAKALHRLGNRLRVGGREARHLLELLQTNWPSWVVSGEVARVRTIPTAAKKPPEVELGGTL